MMDIVKRRDDRVLRSIEPTEDDFPPPFLEENL